MAEQFALFKEAGHTPGLPVGAKGEFDF